MGALSTTTPKRRKGEKDRIWYTPKNSSDVKAQLDLLCQDLSSINRSVRAVASKAGKELDRKNAMIAGLVTKCKHLETAMKSRKPIGRKAVKYNPNKAFATIPQIVKAQFEAKQAAQRYVAAHGANLEAEAREINQSSMDDLTSEFQL